MPQVTEPTLIWEKVKTELSELLPRDIFDSWFVSVECLSADGNSVILQVQSEFSAIWINDNYLDLLTKAFQRFLGHPVTVSLVENPADDDTVSNNTRHTNTEKSNFRGNAASAKQRN